MFRLTKEKYKKELNKIRAGNTAQLWAEVFLILFGGYSSVESDNERVRKKYLKHQISLCNKNIKNISNKIE